jgi:hypothetical protein
MKAAEGIGIETLGRQRAGEARPLARPARDGDRAAHRRHDARRDGEAEADAAHAPRRVGAGLLELPEDAVEVLRRQTRPGVGDGEHQAAVGLVDLQRHAALRGELDRIADEVEDDLAQAVRIGHDAASRGGCDMAGDVDALFVGARRHQFHRVLEQVMQIGLDGTQLEAARLDGGEVQQILHEAEQGGAGTAHGGDVALLLWRQRRALQKVGHAENAVQRRAQFVADHGEEAGLGAACLLGALARLDERRLLRGLAPLAALQRPGAHGPGRDAERDGDEQRPGERRKEEGEQDRAAEHHEQPRQTKAIGGLIGGLTGGNAPAARRSARCSIQGVAVGILQIGHDGYTSRPRLGKI